MALVLSSEEAVGIVSDALVVTVDLSRVLPSPDLVCFFSIAGRRDCLGSALVPWDPVLVKAVSTT